MPAKRVISLAESGGGVWTVRALHAEAIDLSKAGKLDTPAFRSALKQGVRASVPGCVHHALIAARLIESPDVGDAEARLQWIGSTEWEYRCQFDWAGAGGAMEGDATRTELVLDGLDTVAEVSLNGQVVGRAESFFFPHRFDIDHAIRAGRNQLAVRFTPPRLHIREEEARLGARPFNGDESKSGWEPFIFIRKPACNLGWDWGPKVATVGVAGGVSIERWSVARIEHVRPLVVSADALGGHAEIDVHVDIAWGGSVGSAGSGAVSGGAGGRQPQLAITLRDPHGAVVCNVPGAMKLGERVARVRLSVPRPELWWPRGYGAQPLYQLHVELRAGPKPLDVWEGNIGLRTVMLDTSKDHWGSAFTLRVNDRPVFCMGANWIPEGLFAGYAGDEVIRTRVRDAAEMNANMLRVWGGGLYEPRAFYDECDRLGILVWQDFMFSCGMYPEEAPYGGEHGLVAREARHQLSRLSSHASVALWCGGNETIWGHDKWGWRERLKDGQSWGSGYWLDLLPRLCAEVDPSRPYWPNSPWSGVDEGDAAGAGAAESAHRDVLDADHGDRHTWEVDAWMDDFRAPTAGGSGVVRFCSEFGHQSPSNIETLREQFGDQEEVITAAFIAELARRQRGPGGDARWYDAPLAADLGAEAAARLIAQSHESNAGFAAWLACVQDLQARVVARGIEWHRVNRPRCGGVLFWQLNDCWAGHSWSAIDAAGRRKPLWEMARRAMSPRLLSIHRTEAALTLYAVNDTDESWEGEVCVTVENRAHAMLDEKRIHVRIGPRVAGVIAELGDWVKAWSGGQSDLRFVRAKASDESGFGQATCAWMPGWSRKPSGE